MLKYLLLFIATSASAGAAALSFTNGVINFSITNWYGADNANRMFLAGAGDSIIAGQSDNDLVNFSTTSQMGILCNNPNMRQTNGAVSGEVYSQIYPKVTNIMQSWLPRILLLGSPRNDCNFFVNNPTDMWPTLLPTNDLIVAYARARGIRIVWNELIPSSTDYHSVTTNWNAKLREWGTRATNSDVVTVNSNLWNFFASPTNNAFMKETLKWNDLHYNIFGQTNYALITLTSLFQAITIIATTGSRTDVGDAYLLTQDGDRLVIPSGTTAWASNFALTNAITLWGAGSSNATIIQDNTFKITVQLIPNRVTRISGIQLASGTRAAEEAQDAGIIQVVGTNVDRQRIRIDHIFFNSLSNGAVNLQGCLGVMDHFAVIAQRQVPVGFNRHASWNHGTYGDRSYTNGLNFANQDDFFWFEDGYVTNKYSGPNHVTGWDGDGGLRMGLRRLNLFRVSIENHGTESGGRLRGGLGGIIYSNTFTGTDHGQGVGLHRSGVWYWLYNTVSGYTSGANISLENNRSDSAYIPFSESNAGREGANGLNPWDVNAGGGPFMTGTVATYTSGSTISSITVSGTPWTTDQWKSNTIVRTSGKTISSATRSGSIVTVSCTGHGFSTGDWISIRGADQAGYNTTKNVTNINSSTFEFETEFGNSPASPATGTMYCFQGYGFSEIVSNTTDTLYYRSSGQGAGFFLRFAAADTFASYRVTQGMDMIGRIKGSVLSGDTPSRPGGWNDQTTMACYSFGNTREGGVPVEFQPVHLIIRAGEHFFTNTSPPGFVYPAHIHSLVTDMVDEYGDGQAAPSDPTTVGTRGPKIKGIKLR